MLTEERKSTILELLRTQGVVKSQELIQLLNASESTIRRDLQELEESGLLVRVHGGAKKLHALNYEQDMTEKANKNIQEKRLVAKYAASLVADGDVIYLDAGTSTFEMLPFLKNRNITVVTNSIYHASHLTDLKIPTIVIGGTIKISTKAIVGSFSIEQLQHYRFNKAFLGMNGIHSKFGFTTPDTEEALMKRVAMEQSALNYVLADSSKFEQVSFTKVADLTAATILTSSYPKEVFHQLSPKITIKEVTE